MNTPMCIHIELKYKSPLMYFNYNLTAEMLK